jgi:hypothetical protein
LSAELIKKIENLGLRATVYRSSVSNVSVLFDPAAHLMPSGAVPLNPMTFDELREYSSSLPTGQTPGKVWKARLRSGWWLGRYGDPYPKGHEHHGSIPIDWWPIYKMGQPAAWPRDVRVPPPARPGPVAAPLGGADGDEGELCLRDNGRGGFCLTRIEYRPDASLGACQCPNGHPPCGYCVSSAPECPECGWRDES